MTKREAEKPCCQALVHSGLVAVQGESAESIAGAASRATLAKDGKRSRGG